MAGNNTESKRTLPATVAVISIVYNVLFAIVCAYLPYDPLYLGLSVSVYAWAGCALSAFGLLGIVTKWPTLVTSFAHYLFLDTFVSAMCRFMVLELFADALRDQDICGNAAWSRDRLSHDVVTGSHWRQRLVTRGRRCRVVLDVGQMVLVALLIALTAAQGTLALAMRRYGKELDRTKLAVSDVDVEAVQDKGPQRKV